MNHHILTVIVLIFTITACRGQDLTESEEPSSFHVLGITIGINQVKEENLLPLVHSGFITTLSYDYRRSEENYQDFRFALGFSRIIADREDITKSANVPIALSYSYCVRVAEDQRFTLFIGPHAKVAYSLFFYPNWDESHLYWTNSLSVGINNVFSYILPDDTKLFSRLSMPLLSLYSRPSVVRLHKIDDLSFGGIVKNLHSNLNSGFLDAAFAFHFDVEYQFPVFQTKTEVVFYSLDFIRTAKGDADPFTQLIHQLGLRILL